MNSIIKITFILLFAIPLSTTIFGQVLFDNGPFYNRTGTGAGGANESVLYTTTFAMGTIGFGHQIPFYNRVADDFVVDGNWQIDSIVFFAYQTGSTTTSTITAVNFRIWDNEPDVMGSNVVFGDTLTNRLTSTSFSNAYRITETTTGNSTRPIMKNVCATGFPITLTPGTYWLDWATGGTLGSGPWAPARTPLNIAVTGNGKQRINLTWNNALDGGTNTPAQGFPFIIYGSNPIVSIGSNYYSTIEAAIAAVLPGETIVILDDIISNSTNTIPSDVVVQINDGVTWTNNLPLTNNGTITEVGSGNFINGVNGVYKGSGVYLGDFTNNGSLSPGN